MHLVQILLPLADNARHPLDVRLFARIKEELTRHFGGITCYFRAPAEGRWSNEGEDVIDDIVIYEVMLEQVDPGWWADYRKTLERHFQQTKLSSALCPCPCSNPRAPSPWHPLCPFGRGLFLQNKIKMPKGHARTVPK